jgi:hypothetical protein
MKNSFASWDELKNESPDVFEIINMIAGKQWYKCGETGWHYRFMISKEFNPYRFADNFYMATKEQMARLAEEAMYREAAKGIPFREYVSDLVFSTTIIWIMDGGQLVSYEFPEYLTGWLNGIYIGINRKGETNS